MGWLGVRLAVVYTYRSTYPSHTLHTLIQVYYISRGRLRPANKQYTGSINNDYELNLTDDTDVELVSLGRTLPWE